MFLNRYHGRKSRPPQRLTEHSMKSRARQCIKGINGTAYIGQGDSGRIRATQATARHPIEHPIYIGGFSQTALDRIRAPILRNPYGQKKIPYRVKRYGTPVWSPERGSNFIAPQWISRKILKTPYRNTLIKTPLRHRRPQASPRLSLPCVILSKAIHYQPR